MSDRIVLVTGAAGFLGVPVVQRLRANGFPVLAVDDGSAGTLSRLERLPNDPDLMVRLLDIRDRAPLVRLVNMIRPWAVVHLAARHFIPDCEAFPGETLSVNVLGNQNLLDACTENPPQRLVFASSADVYAPSPAAHAEDDLLQPRGVYGNSKLLCEMLLADQATRLPDCATVTARLFNIYGPDDPHPHLIPEILEQADRGSTLHLGDLNAARDYIYVDDAAEALVELLRSKHTGPVNIATGRATTGHDVVEAITDLMGQSFEIHRDESRIRRFARPVSHGSADLLRAILPWWPRISLQDGLRRTMAVHIYQSGGRWAS